MTAAREECEAKVEAIVAECLENNCKFRDSKFDLLNDRRNCLYSSLISETVYNDIAGTKRLPDLFRNPVFFLNGASPDDIKQVRKKKRGMQDYPSCCEDDEEV